MFCARHSCIMCLRCGGVVEKVVKKEVVAEEKSELIPTTLPDQIDTESNHGDA